MKLGLWVNVIGVLMVVSLPLSVGAAEQKKAPAAITMTSNSDLSKLTPHQVLDEVTGKVVGIARREGDKIKAEPAAYYDEFSTILDSVIDFPFIAKAVMGKQYYPSATQKQRDDFAEAFKRDLIKTYTGALAIYSDREFKILPSSDAVPATGRLSVIQQVTGPEGKLEVAYTMARKNATDPWKMINFTLPGQGVNLGATARTQFAQAMASNKGDLDALILNWGK